MWTTEVKPEEVTLGCEVIFKDGDRKRHGNVNGDPVIVFYPDHGTQTYVPVHVGADNANIMVNSCNIVEAGRS